MRRQFHVTGRFDRQPRSAFTLIEVLLVLAIIGVIAALAVPQLLGQQQKALIQATQAKIKGLEETVKLFAIDNDGNYPSGGSDQVFGMLLNPGQDKNGRQRPALIEEVPTDAWGNNLNYEYPPSGNRTTPGGKPAIWSAGPDKQDGTDDDVTNWNQKL